MHKIRTSTLLVLSVLLYIAGGLFRYGVTCVRPVKDATGVQLYRGVIGSG